MADPNRHTPQVELALERAFGNLDEYLRGQLDRLHEEDGLLVADEHNISNMDSLWRTLRVQMEQLGYRDAVMQQVSALEELQREILDEYPQQASDRFAQVSAPALQMLLRGAEADLLNVADAASAQVAELLRTSAVGGGSLDSLIDKIHAKIGYYRANAITLAQSALQSFYSFINVRLAESVGYEWFAYLGPDDQVTREWCDHWVGRRGRIEDFEETADQWGRENQPPGVRVWRGGYNCRHQLVPISGKSLKDYKAGPR